MIVNPRTRARIEAERTIPLGIYRDAGADGRCDYLEGLAESHGLSIEIVLTMADLLGAEEDFDGLACACEDAEGGFGMGGGQG